jgi:hypothetical protein
MFAFLTLSYLLYFCLARLGRLGRLGWVSFVIFPTSPMGQVLRLFFIDGNILSQNVLLSPSSHLFLTSAIAFTFF